MDGNELRQTILEGAMKKDGIPPTIAKWLLKLEEVITRQGVEIEDLKSKLNAEPSLRIDYGK